jgi:hypothetical protein
VVIAGLEIPSDSPVFLGILAIHVPVGLLAVVTGVAAMLKDKRRGAHTRFGLIYFWCLGVLFFAEMSVDSPTQFETQRKASSAGSVAGADFGLCVEQISLCSV